MLTLLRVSGFALIDEVELPLGPGLTVITGETGAGKSILVEALGLLRGGRASTDLIRAGAEEARVEAIFELAQDSELRAALVDDGRELGDGLVVRRAVARSGRGRVHLGGGLATTADLAASVGKMCDITSQHDQQLLTDPESQLAILDAFAGHALPRILSGNKTAGSCRNAGERVVIEPGRQSLGLQPGRAHGLKSKSGTAPNAEIRRFEETKTRI